MEFQIEDIKIPHLFSYNQLTLGTGFYTVIGANGTGKSTLLAAIEENADGREDIVVESYDVYTTIKQAYDTSILGNSSAVHMRAAFIDSNGEFILRKFGDFIQRINSLRSSLESNPHKCVMILADGLDDGANIPMISFFKLVLREKFETIKSLADECIVLLSANQYETTRNTNVIDVHTGKIIEIKSYDDFKSQVMKSYQLYVQRQSERLSMSIHK